MEAVTYKVAAEHDGEGFAASLTLPDGKTFDVGEALSGGTFTTDDPMLVTMLDGFHGVERDAPAAATTTAKTTRKRTKA